MGALLVVMQQILLQGSPQRRFSNQDQPRQTFFFDRLHPAFCVRVQIRASCWQSKRLHAFRFDQFSKGFAELHISVMQQIAAASQASPLLHGQVSRLLLHPPLVLCLAKTSSDFQGVLPAECSDVTCLRWWYPAHRRSTWMLLILWLFERDDIFGRHSCQSACSCSSATF